MLPTTYDPGSYRMQGSIRDISDFLKLDTINASINITFDDVLLVPKYSEIVSRSQCTLKSLVSSRTGHTLELGTPIMSASMDTITGLKMAKKLAEFGGLGVIHRYMPTKEGAPSTGQILQEWIYDKSPLAFTVGSVFNDKERIDLITEWGSLNWGYSNFGSKVISVDIAHGHSKNMKDTLDYIRNTCKFPGFVIAGNIATHEGARDLYTWGADLIKVNIGGGSVCSTRTKTGVGVPQFSALLNASLAGVPLIADGCFKDIGDIPKALGVRNVMAIMTGSLFAGTDCCPGWVEESHLVEYRGMASKEAREQFKGKYANEEGISTYVTNKGAGSTERVIKEIEEGIKSAMSYVGAMDLQKFQDNAEFIRVSPSTAKENRPHMLER